MSTSKQPVDASLPSEEQPSKRIKLTKSLEEQDGPIQTNQQTSDQSNQLTIDKLLTSDQSLIWDSDNSPKFNIPWMLLSDPRCSVEFAHYVLDFVDPQDILFGISALNHAHHDHVTLTDNQWWKKRLAHQFGTNVTRWSDVTLSQWRAQWPQSKQQYWSYPRHVKRKALGKRLKRLPLWHSAAVHLITRLKNFVRDIFGQSDQINLPSALIHVLLVSPPFQRATDWMLPLASSNYGYKLWKTSNDFKSKNALWRRTQKSPHCWFSTSDEGPEKTFLALYTGTCYVEDDENTQHIGSLVDGAREIVFTDPNLWPVLEWVTSESDLFWAASNFHEFCVNNGVYRYCKELSASWDEAAGAYISSDDDEVEHDYEKDEESEYDDEESREDDEEDKEHETKHPCAPSLQVKLVDNLMKRVGQNLLQNINRTIRN